MATKNNLKILISGYYGFDNAGDEAILTAMLQNFGRLWPNASCSVLSGNPSETTRIYGVKSIHRFHFGEIISAINSSDVFISGGGSLLQDVTSKRSLLYYLFIIYLAKLFGKPVMLYAQGVGPINSVLMRRVTGWVLKKVDLISVRDADSAKLLLSLGLPKEKIHITADAVFMLPKAQLQDGKILLKRSGFEANAKIVGVAVRSWKEDKFIGALVDALDALASEGSKILLIPFQNPIDVAVAQKVSRALRHPAKILDKVNGTEEILSVMGNLDLLIGMRLHSLICAAVMGVPFVALEYDPKVASFVKGIGAASAGDVDNLTTKKILDAAQDAYKLQVDLSALERQAGENNLLLKQLTERS